MHRDQELLDRVGEFLECEVRPEAERIDRDTEALRSALHGMARLGLLALKRPLAFGGPEASEDGFQNFNERIARYSGALAFLQTQHQGVVGVLSASQNEALKAEYLPLMADGGKLVGVGFSQLRRPGPPIMRAEQMDGGYSLSGHVPWVTGWDLFPEFMVAAVLPDGRAVFAPVPLRSETGLSVSPPMRLAAMESADTATVDFDAFFVPETRVAMIREASWIRNSDQLNIAQQGSFAMGCSQAGLDILLRNADKRGLDFARQAHDRLAAELAQIREESTRARQAPEETAIEDRLRLRDRQIELAVRCAHAAVASSSGAANSLDHPAQRVYREALVFTVSAQTGPIMEATLDLISRAMPQPASG